MSLARNATASIAQVVVSSLAMLLNYRLMMHYLSIQEIGLWALVMGSTTVARLSEFGLGGGVMRFVAGDLARGERDSAARSIGMAVVVLSIVGTCFALLLRPFLHSYLVHATPATLHHTVEHLLPAALAVVVLGTVANVFTNALDGCQRMDVRSGLQSLGNLVQLGVTWWVLPRYGADGLGWPQIAQSLILLLLAAPIAVRLIGAQITAYAGFDAKRLEALFTYGGGLQVIGIAQMMFEPIIKVLLNHFGGIASTGYFDMANKILLQFRSLLVAGYNAIVPHVAARSATGVYDKQEIAATYRHSLGLLLLVLLPYGAVAAAGIPLALAIWKGSFDPVFVQVTLAMNVGWLLNSLNPPAYLIYVALGRLRWNMISQLATGVFMVAAGPIAGHFWGGPGVLACAIIALALGSLVVVQVFHRDFGIVWVDFITPARLTCVGLAVLAMALSWRMTLGSRPGWPVLTALPLGTAVLAMGAAWFDPMRAEVMGRIAKLARR